MSNILDVACVYYTIRDILKKIKTKHFDIVYGIRIKNDKDLIYLYVQLDVIDDQLITILYLYRSTRILLRAENVSTILSNRHVSNR